MGGCGGLERTDFNIFYFGLWEGVVVLKELILTFSTVEDVVVLKELICNSFYFGRVWSFKELILTVSTLGGCGGLERTHL